MRGEAGLSCLLARPTLDDTQARALADRKHRSDRPVGLDSTRFDHCFWPNVRTRLLEGRKRARGRAAGRRGERERGGDDAEAREQAAAEASCAAAAAPAEGLTLRRAAAPNDHHLGSRPGFEEVPCSPSSSSGSTRAQRPPAAPFLFVGGRGESANQSGGRRNHRLSKSQMRLCVGEVTPTLSAAANHSTARSQSPGTISICQFTVASSSGGVAKTSER